MSQPPRRSEPAPAEAAQPARRAPADRRADRAAGPDDRAVRDRRHRRAAPGRAAAQRRLREPDRVQERLHRGGGRRRGRGRRDCRDERRLHPARGRRPDRHLEHGRHHPHRRRLRHPAGQPQLVLRHHRRRVCPGGHGDRQLVDDCGHPRRGVRRHEQRPRARRGGCGRRGHLRRVLRRQDDAVVGDHDPGSPARGRRSDRRAARPEHGLDGRAGTGDQPRAVLLAGRAADPDADISTDAAREALATAFNISCSQPAAAGCCWSCWRC